MGNTMGGTQLEEGMRQLERQLEDLRVSKPACDTTGAHDVGLLQLEDGLDDKRKALAREQDDDRTAP